MKKHACLTLAATASLASSGYGAITLAINGFAQGAPPTLSTMDLATTAVVTLSAGGLSNGANLNALNDGVVGTPTSTDGSNTALDVADEVTLTFDTVANPLGYDISEIFTVAGWATGAGTATLIPGAHHNPNSPTSFWTSVQFTESTGAPLTNGTVVATGVSAVSFDITENAIPGGIVVYREIDIIGTPTVPVPEPSTALLGGFALLGLLRRRR